MSVTPKRLNCKQFKNLNIPSTEGLIHQDPSSEDIADFHSKLGFLPELRVQFQDHPANFWTH